MQTNSVNEKLIPLLIGSELSRDIIQGPQKLLWASPYVCDQHSPQQHREHTFSHNNNFGFRLSEIPLLVLVCASSPCCGILLWWVYEILILCDLNFLSFFWFVQICLATQIFQVMKALERLGFPRFSREHLNLCKHCPLHILSGPCTHKKEKALDLLCFTLQIANDTHLMSFVLRICSPISSSPQMIFSQSCVSAKRRITDA